MSAEYGVDGIFDVTFGIVSESPDYFFTVVTYVILAVFKGKFSDSARICGNLRRISTYSDNRCFSANDAYGTVAFDGLTESSHNFYIV